jgi:hypothetical protein
VSPSLVEAARPRFKKEADTIRAALAERLGRSVKFNLVAAEDYTAVGDPDRPRPQAAPPSPEPPVPEPEEDAVGVTDAPPRRPEARLAEEFGATVVDEVPRQ